jgi:catechol 2,3-dioxygenase-like lactoylglutathione lyase family enzyme
MLSHVHIGITEFERAFAFYGGLMEVLGFPLRFSEPERGSAGWMPRDAKRPLVLIGRPYDGGRAEPGNGQMVALLAKSRDVVDRSYAYAVAKRVQCEGEPGLRPHYHAHYYGAYFRDPDGNKLCVCCHDPPSDE